MRVSLPAPLDDNHALIGRELAFKYVIETYLGGGAMGAVYRARQTALDRVVAIKVMHPELARVKNFTARFHQEAKAASRLSHPCSVGVTDFGEEPDGLLYLVMEFVDGRTLDQIIQREWPLPAERMAVILGQVLSAVAVAHDLGIVHRDLKPENILVYKGLDEEGLPTDRVKVCDFGIATMLRVGEAHEGLEPSTEGGSSNRDSKPLLTQIGAILGTPAYMSPEQASGGRPDARSDLYALGAVLYEMLTKRPPFEGETVESILAAHVHIEPVHPLTVLPSCDSALSEVAMVALSKAPADRFPNARAMRAGVRRTHQGGLLEDTLEGPLTRSALRLTAIATESAAAGEPLPVGAELPRKLGRTTSEDTSNVVALPLASKRLPAPEEPTPRVDSPQQGAGPIAAVPPKAAPTRRALMVASVLLAVVLLAALFGLPAKTTRSSGGGGNAPRPSGEMASPRPAEAPSSTSTIGAVAFSLTSSSAAPTSRPSTPTAAVALRPAQPTSTPNSPRIEPSSAPPMGVAPTASAVSAPTSVPTQEPRLPAPPVSTSAIPAAAAPYSPVNARVIASVSATYRTSRGGVAALVSHVAFGPCYQSALRTLGRPEGGRATLHLEIDEDGIIQSATCSAPAPLRSAGTCFASLLRLQRLSQPPDTGSATADVFLELLP